jgi:hypothetical protein
MNNGQLLAFIEETPNCVTFLHVTQKEKDAKNILKKGFRYTDNYHKTVDEFSNHNIVSLDWIRIMRKDYGNFVMIIQIDKDVYKRNSYNIDSMCKESIRKTKYGDEEVYTLPAEFVKGYFDEGTKTITRNANFYLNK